jgi:hypothetical protein
VEDSKRSEKQYFAVWIVRRRGEAQIKSGFRTEGGWVWRKALQAAIPSSVKMGSGRYWFFEVGGSWCWPWPWRIRWMRVGGIFLFVFVVGVWFLVGCCGVVVMSSRT